MVAIKKAYGYITNEIDGIKKVLVFEHPLAGVQIPKGTVEHDEEPAQAVIREMEEETGLTQFEIKRLIGKDLWKSDNDEIHERYFYELIALEKVESEWFFQPQGGGEEEGLTFRFFWVSEEDQIEIARGHDDYFSAIF